MEYGPVPSSRFDEVIAHLRQHFPDEPFNKCVGLCQTGVPCELLEKHHIHTLEEGLSVMAWDSQTGEIAGVALNGVCKKGENEVALEEMKSVDNNKYRQIFGLLYKANIEVDLYSKFGIDEIFELRILSVNSKFRGKGIAKELFVRSELLAEENGYKLMKVDATSSFSQRIAESCGLTTAKAVRYGDFKDENGKSIYVLEAPHEFYKVMCKELGCGNQ